MPVPKRLQAFTLIELLVVISIIALLIALLMPALGQARLVAEMAVCGSQSRQIGIAIKLYTDDYEGRMHPAPNHGLWENPATDEPWTLDAINAIRESTGSHALAYWAVAYKDYMNNHRDVFRCPSAQLMDVDPGYTDWINQDECTYGLNGFLVQSSPQTGLTVKVEEKFVDPTLTIVAHDAWEHLLDNNGDMLSSFDQPINITQYRSQSYGDQAVFEYYRHMDNSQVLWLDGHVSPIKKSDGTDIPSTWYTGEPPVKPTRGTRRGGRP